MKYCQNRRKFIRSSFSGLVGAGISSSFLSSACNVKSDQPKSRVAVVINERAISSDNVCNRKETALMLEKALFTITGKKKPEEAWKALGVTKDDVIGIKVNCNGAGFPLYAHTELVYALTDSLTSVVRPNNIIIYERYTRELTRAGFQENRGNSGVRCFDTDNGGGFHQNEGLTRIITDLCTKIINVPTLKAFGREFVASLFLKNHVGSLPPNMMSNCHGNARFISEVCSRQSIKNKTVLAVCDGLRGNYKRGVPWYWKGIIMSRDPVAAEYTAIQAINEKLVEEKNQKVSVPSYVKLAETEYGLGTCTPSKINILKSVL